MGRLGVGARLSLAQRFTDVNVDSLIINTFSS